MPKKRVLFFILSLLFTFVCFLYKGFTEDSARWHLPEGASARLGKGDPTDVQFSPDGTQIAVASSIGIWLYDAQTYQEIDLLTDHTRGIGSCTYSPDGTMLVGGGADGTLLLWDVPTRRLRTTLKGHERSIVTLAFSSDGSTLASGANYEGTVQLWNVVTGEHRATFAAHTDGIRAVTFSPDSRTLASGSRDGSVRLWDVVTGEDRAILTTARVSALAFSPDGKTLAVGSSANAIQLWDMHMNQRLESLMGHTYTVSAVVFSPDGTLLASGSGNGTVRLWDADTGQQRAVLTAHTRHVYSLAFSPAERLQV